MSARRVWIVGAGKRVRETALPALLSLPGSFEVASVLARSSREIEAGGRRFRVRALADLRPEETSPRDLVYVAVGKDAVPAVLSRLRDLDRAHLELLIDTPVLRFKHLRHRALLDGWWRAGVAEDTIHLPWYETARSAAGSPTRVVFDRSAYAYHGLAQAKALTGSPRVLRARRVKTGEGRARREIELEGGRFATVLEPRDYSRGRVLLEGSKGRVADRIEPAEDAIRLEAIVENGLCAGFRAGDVVERLLPEEAELTRGDPAGASVTARMDAMKRVGFRRLLESIAAGRGAPSIEDGLEDMAADWFLERFGRWRAAPLFDVRRGIGRAAWSALGRLG